MVLLQPKLQLRVSQRQILTPGLVQMVSVLALNKLELKDMITAEMVENPVLEELEDSVPLIDDVSRLLSHQRRLNEVRSATQPLGSLEPLSRARLSSRRRWKSAVVASAGSVVISRQSNSRKRR